MMNRIKLGTFSSLGLLGSAVVLLAAGFSKLLYPTQAILAAADRYDISPRAGEYMTVFISVMEIALALALAPRVMRWLAAHVLMGLGSTMLAVAAADFVLGRHEDCGCFGPIAVLNGLPGRLFACAVFIASAVAYIRATEQIDQEAATDDAEARRGSWGKARLALVALTPVLLLLGFLLRNLRANEVIEIRAVGGMGQILSPGGYGEWVFEVTNLTSSEVFIRKHSTSCTCQDVVIAEDLLGPLGSTRVAVTMNAPDDSGAISGEAILSARVAGRGGTELVPIRIEGSVVRIRGLHIAPRIVTCESGEVARVQVSVFVAGDREDGASDEEVRLTPVPGVRVIEQAAWRPVSGRGRTKGLILELDPEGMKGGTLEFRIPGTELVANGEWRLGT
jgi:Methylamine utilisation protein MauE